MQFKFAYCLKIAYICTINKLSKNKPNTTMQEEQFYEVNITETFVKTIIVKSTSRSDAMTKVREKYANGEIQLNYVSDFVDSDIFTDTSYDVNDFDQDSTDCLIIE